MTFTTFYKNYAFVKKAGTDSLLGIFDLFLWADFKNNRISCETLQRKPFYKIALTTGTATYQSNDQSIKISGKNVVFIDPIARCSFSTEDLKFDAQYCIFNEGFLRGTSRFLSNWPVFDSGNIYAQALTVAEYNDINTIFNVINDEYLSSYPYKEQVIQNRVLDVIHYTQKLNPHLVAKPLPVEDLYHRFLTTIEDEFATISVFNPLKDKSSCYFAKRLDTDLHRLNRVLKKITGKTAQNIIHERILIEANILLRHSSYVMKEIAWCLNFKETSHFLNFYKKKTGKTPSLFRNH